jgi:hypothetical protein
MLDHQSAVAVGVSYVDAASVQYLVVAIMFSAPAVGVVAFFAQTVGASAQCDVNWTPVVQSSERFVVRGGEIPFAAIKPFTLLHLALLVATLAGLAVFTVMAWTSPHYTVRYDDGNIDTAILEDQIRGLDEAATTQRLQLKRDAAEEQAARLKGTIVAVDPTAAAVLSVVSEGLPEVPVPHIRDVLVHPEVMAVCSSAAMEDAVVFRHRAHGGGGGGGFIEIAFLVTKVPRQGVGRALINEVKRRAKEKAVKFIFTYADGDAIG